MVAAMDEKQEKSRIAKLRGVEKQRQLRIADYVKRTMASTDGREFMYWLLSVCKIGQNPFTGNALTTGFACGELNVGQQVQALIIEHSPADFLKMLTEKESERTNGNFEPDTVLDNNVD